VSGPEDQKVSLSRNPATTTVVLVGLAIGFLITLSAASFDVVGFFVISIS